MLSKLNSTQCMFHIPSKKTVQRFRNYFATSNLTIESINSNTANFIPFFFSTIKKNSTKKDSVWSQFTLTNNNTKQKTEKVILMLKCIYYYKYSGCLVAFDYRNFLAFAKKENFFGILTNNFITFGCEWMNFFFHSFVRSLHSVCCIYVFHLKCNNEERKKKRVQSQQEYGRRKLLMKFKNV